MSTNYNANPINAPKIVKPGESKEYVGTRNITDLLPDIFQTTVNKQFLNSTLEQLLTSGSLEALNYFVGTGNVTDNYLRDNRTADHYQFVPGAVNKNNNGDITRVLSYDDMINALEYNEVNVSQHNKILNESAYTLDLPINYDMFTNYHNYFWLADSIPICEIRGTSTDVIDMDAIAGKFTYTTPVLSDGKTLELKNGMRIRFNWTSITRYNTTAVSDTFAIGGAYSHIKVYINNDLQEASTDYTIVGTDVVLASPVSANTEIEIHLYNCTGSNFTSGATYIVDGVGSESGIQLTLQYYPSNIADHAGRLIWKNLTVYTGKTPTMFDADGEGFEFRVWDQRESRIAERDYVVEQRFSQDQSAWARTNLWVHYKTVEAVCAFTGDDVNTVAKETLRAVRPIIEYRANIEKHNFGKRQISYVTHMYNTVTTPSTQFVGQTEFNLASHLITDVWTTTGYNRGDRVKRTISGQDTFWDCIKTHSDAHDPVHYENRIYWRPIIAKDVEENDYVVFLNSNEASYNNTIFRVTGVGTSITLTPYISSFNDYDKITVINGYNSVYLDSDDELIYGGSEWYWTNNQWTHGQQKTAYSTAPKVQLYDIDAIALDNPSVYPNSTFAGDVIFDYGKGTTKVDEALKFAPRYVDYGNNPGLSFDLGLGAVRYTYNKVNSNLNYQTNNDSGTIEDIKGYYYYKNIESESLYNGWVELRGGQKLKRRAQKTVTTTSSPLVFKLGTDQLINSNNYRIESVFTKFRFYEQVANRLERINGHNPSLFLVKGKTYTFQTSFDPVDIEFVNDDGTPATDVTKTVTSSNVFTLSVNATPNNIAVRYRHTTSSASKGVIYFVEDIGNYNNNFKVRKNSETILTGYSITGTDNNLLQIDAAGLALNDVYEVTWFSDADLVDADGEFLPSDAHIYNPQNDILTQVSFGDLQEHIRQQMTKIPTFSGEYFGINNYDSTSRAHQFGGTIRQQPFSTELLAQTIMDTDTNPYSAIKYVSNSYEQFKKKLVNKVKQLHNQTDTSVPVYELVDTALKDINLGKSENSEFAKSDMIMYENYESRDYTWVSGQSTVFELPMTVNTYEDARNHIQVYVKDDTGTGNTVWRALRNEIDYILSDTKVTITASVNFDSSGRAYAHVRWFPQNALSFVPPSAVKIGLVKPYLPAIYYTADANSDGTFSTRAIICHDGSIYTQQGTELFDRINPNFNIEDATVWEFETRVYNNLSVQLNPVTDYRKIMPNNNRVTPHTWSDVTVALTSAFNSWQNKNNITSLTPVNFYDASNPFTWNYSSMAPYIGGYKGLYTYYFNTFRPHTHPWEMFGYTKKPNWWDANYSWTDVTKRAALITALIEGHYNNPADTPLYNISYSYSNFDWTNDIVDITGALQDPMAAGMFDPLLLVGTANEFEFGDWGPVEDQWRRSSSYKFELIAALAKLRPLWVINTYFDSIRRVETTNLAFDTMQIYYEGSRLLNNHRIPKLTYTAYEDSIIESIVVKNGGSGYTSEPTLTVYSNFGQDGSAIAIVESGVVTGASVVNPGRAYQSKPSVIASSGNATFDVILLEGAKKYYSGLSNAIVEYALFNKTHVESIAERFANLTYNPIVKVGGFTNPNNQQFILESSQDKGKVILPEENYTSILHTGHPKNEVFFGAIKVTKTASGFTISGYDNSKLYFEYNEPMGNVLTLVTAGNTTVKKFRSYNEIKGRLNYNSNLPDVQDVYDLVLGYGKHLQLQGWIATWESAAADFIIWNETANTGDVFNIIPDPNTIEVIDPAKGYYDNISKKYDGVYNLIDSNGRQLLPNKVIITRDTLSEDGAITSITTKDPSTKIYGVRMYAVEIEHAIVFDNSSDFDDVVYNPALGQLHRRIQWRGNRTKNWNGKLYSPGYIVTDNTIVNNFDTTAREIDQYYGPSQIVNNTQLSDVARFNIGYNKPNWAAYTTLDDDTLFEFMKGSRKYRGTRFALDAFMRNNSLFGSTASAQLHEEWAIRTGDYGDVRSRDTIEFEIQKDLLQTSPQPIRFSADELNDTLTDTIIDVDANSPLLVTGTPGANFRTRPARTFNTITISDEAVYASDFVTAGLPLTTETDYRVINRSDFLAFPTESHEDYDFSGEWQDIAQWDNQTAYKYGDKVIYNGRVWEMVDETGTTGLARPNDPIQITGSVTLPVIPSSGQTLIIDGTTINLQNTTTATTLNLISAVGTNDIASTAVVPHGTTLVIGISSSNNQTITFSNIVNTTVYQDIVKTGTVTDPVIVGSSTKKLIIDGTSVLFNETVASSTNITAKAVWEQVFNSTFTAPSTNTQVGTVSAEASLRNSAINSLRTAFLAVDTQANWITWWNAYIASGAGGVNVNYLLSEIAAAPSYQAQIEGLLSSDVRIINGVLNRTYVPADIISGIDTVSSADITSTQTAISGGTYIAEFNTWITSVFTSLSDSTVITTEPGTEFKEYSLTDIVNKINTTGIANITASASGNKLRIVKTTTTSTVPFSLTISAASANAEVGFNATTQTINATSTIVTTTPNLTMSQVLDHINNAGFAGITAQAYAPSGLLLNILSSNETLYIGAGTANSIIGLTQGVVPATSTVSTTSVATDLTRTIELINNASISGVTASNSSNKLKITSINSTLVIGSGTANSTVGFIAQTYTATQTTISNVFNAFVTRNGQQVEVFREVENDPTIFSIWVADDSTQGRSNLGYSVYQTMEFGFSIKKACAGVTPADDAMIMINVADANIQAHNLQVGDYVLIRGSNTVPSIDGIHKVTSNDPDSTITFYIDEYIEQEGNAGNIYPIRKIRFSNYASMLSNFNSTTNGIYNYNFAGIRQNNQQKPILVFVDDNGDGKPAVYKWTGTFDVNNGHLNGTWLEVRAAEPQARNDLIENVKIYDAERQTIISTIETFDPAKGIIPGFISEEIDFKLTADIASYNYNSLQGYMENKRTWSDTEVGKRWWDLTSAVYLDYEQGSIDYQQSNWGRLFDGASIDIYEWTRSPVVPDQWETLVNNNTLINGKEATGEAYYKVIDGEKIYSWTEQTFYNPIKRTTETQYFFWVKNKTNYIGQRDYTVYQLARLLENPTAFDITWCAASGDSFLFLTNIDNLVTNNSVVQVNQIYNGDTLPLTEWTLLSDGDPDSTIPEYFHIKIRDSLVGYNQNTRVYTFTDFNIATVYGSDVVVREGTKYYLSLASSNVGNTPSTDTTQTYWREILEYTLPQDTMQDDIEVWMGQPVPDLGLHEYNRYGQLTRPRQSLYRNLIDARQNFISSANSLLSEICVVSEINGWDRTLSGTWTDGVVTYDISKYWNFIDWVHTDFDPTIKPDSTVTYKSQLYPISNYAEGTEVYVREAMHTDNINRPEIWKVVDGEWKLVWKKKGTIKLSEELWNQSKFGHGFDTVGFDIAGFDSGTSNILKIVFDELRNTLFTGRFAVMYNRLWFNCLYQAVVDNTTDDFAFKTTYVKLNINHPVLLNKGKYRVTTPQPVEDFLNSIKPFHTKLRNTTERVTHIEAGEVTVNEQERQAVITMKYDRHCGRTWAGDVDLSGGSFTTSTYDTTLESAFTTTVFDSTYDGNIFVQPVEEGWCEELYPVDFTENISIKIQTNASGSTEDADSRAFRMTYFEPYNLEENSVIVDAAKTTVQTDVTPADTDIEVANASVLTQVNGVVWIGNERVEYGAVDGNTLRYCNRGTYGTSANVHVTGTVVTDASEVYDVTSIRNFAHYGNNLRHAFNDDGVSLSTAGTTSEHANIRNAGKGTL